MSNLNHTYDLQISQPLSKLGLPFHRSHLHTARVYFCSFLFWIWQMNIQHLDIFTSGEVIAPNSGYACTWRSCMCLFKRTEMEGGCATERGVPGQHTYMQFYAVFVFSSHSSVAKITLTHQLLPIYMNHASSSKVDNSQQPIMLKLIISLVGDR